MSIFAQQSSVKQMRLLKYSKEIVVAFWSFFFLSTSLISWQCWKGGPSQAFANLLLETVCCNFQEPQTEFQPVVAFLKS